MWRFFLMKLVQPSDQIKLVALFFFIHMRQAGKIINRLALRIQSSALENAR